MSGWANIKFAYKLANTNSLTQVSFYNSQIVETPAKNSPRGSQLAIGKIILDQDISGLCLDQHGQHVLIQLMIRYLLHRLVFDLVEHLDVTPHPHHNISTA